MYNSISISEHLEFCQFLECKSTAPQCHLNIVLHTYFQICQSSTTLLLRAIRWAVFLLFFCEVILGKLSWIFLKMPKAKDTHISKLFRLHVYSFLSFLHLLISPSSKPIRPHPPPRVAVVRVWVLQNVYSGMSQKMPACPSSRWEKPFWKVCVLGVEAGS